MNKHFDRFCLGLGVIVCIAALLAIAAAVVAIIRNYPTPMAVVGGILVGIYTIGWAFDKLGFCE